MRHHLPDRAGRRRRRRPQRLGGARSRGRGMRVDLAALDADRLAGLARSEIGGGPSPATPPSRRRSPACSRPWSGARRSPDFVLYNPSHRVRGPLVDLDPEAVARARGDRLRRLPRGAAGGAADAAAGAGRDALHRRLGERQGLRAIGALRDGQVRAARPRPEHGARARAEGHPRRPLRHRRRRSASGGRSGRGGRAGTMLDPDAIAETYLEVLASPAAPGPGRSSCGPGWSGSDRSAVPYYLATLQTYLPGAATLFGQMAAPAPCPRRPIPLPLTIVLFAPFAFGQRARIGRWQGEHSLSRPAVARFSRPRARRRWRLSRPRAWARRSGGKRGMPCSSP